MKERRNWIIGLALFLITLWLYWPTTHFPFVNYDDPSYVSSNPEVLKGISPEGIKWSTTAIVVANWHPLTVLSHMLDCSIYGTFAGGHHLTNILLHSVNAVLLWLLLMRMLKTFWLSAFVAALFAWHPMNVESVAWIAERKNVLSMFFFILTLWSYLSYAQRPGALRYILVSVLFTLGLMAKPILVTVPFLLLLLDFWPLQRISLNTNGKGIGVLLVEKIPLLLLACTDSIITYIAQKNTGSVKALDSIPLASRLPNVPNAYVSYLEKLFYPHDLCVLYVFPAHPRVAAAIISIVVLGIITAVACMFASKFRWLFTGWFWFLGTLVPVIGFVQTGIQSAADRHVYLSSIGIFLVVACGINEWLLRRPRSAAAVVCIAVLLLGANLVLARRQIMYWQSSVALFTQALTVNPRSPETEDMLATAYSSANQLGPAIEHYAAAVRLRPGDPELQYHLGRELIAAGRFSEAEGPLAAALVQMPDDAVLLNTYGVALMQDRKPKDAEKEFGRAIEVLPSYSKPYFNLSKVLLAEGDNGRAITNLLVAIKLDPHWPEAWETLAAAYAGAGNLSNAISAAGEALQIAQADAREALAKQIAAELKMYQDKQSSIPAKDGEEKPRH